MKRIHIIGSAGSGKTVLAAALASALEIPHVELDSLFWQENWQQTATEVFRDRVREALAADSWVTDGNYSKARDIVWARVQVVVWLDYPLPLIFWRLLRRSVARAVSGELLWGRNRETFRDLFFSRDSLLWYLLKTHRRRTRQYAGFATSEEFQHIKFVRLRSPRQTGAWFDGVTSPPARSTG
ncbi:MAG: hypothetical protein PVI99_01895 [Anaerolineales bacterium]|jgi:adenylate kinase family enzyme